MVEIKNTRVYGLEEAIKRSGYPTRWEEPEDYLTFNDGIINQQDLKRARSLASCKSGTGHDTFLKGIRVTADIKYSLYFTKQLQRYSFLDIISSMSSMHTITRRESVSDFVNKYVDDEIIEIVDEYIGLYNQEMDKDKQYYYFMKIVSNLPSGYETWMSISVSYLQLKTMYQQRRNHKLKEDWGAFCDWIESLPKFKELILERD
jgi:hypothetical protein